MHAGFESDVACAVNGVAGSLQCVADDCVIDFLRLNARCFKRAARGDRTQIDCRNILQRADIFTHRRALTTQYENFLTHCLTSSVTNYRSKETLKSNTKGTHKNTRGTSKFLSRTLVVFQ